MNISNEIHNLIQSLSIPDRTVLTKEIGELMSNRNLPQDLAEETVYKKYYGEEYKNILKQEIIAEKSIEIDAAINDKLNLILSKIDMTESNLSSLLQNKVSYYVNQGYDGDKALEIARAELIFDSPDTSKLEHNIKSQESTASSIDSAVELLMRL